MIEFERYLRYFQLASSRRNQGETRVKLEPKVELVAFQSQRCLDEFGNREWRRQYSKPLHRQTQPTVIRSAVVLVDAGLVCHSHGHAVKADEPGPEALHVRGDFREHLAHRLRICVVGTSALLTFFEIECCVSQRI